MLRRARRRIKFNIIPLLLSVILLFTFSVRTGVFSPKNARAAVIADDIITAGAIVAWLSAAGIAIGAKLVGNNATQEQAAAFMKDLCKQYETAKNLATGFVFSQIAGAINDTIIFVDEAAVKPAIQFGKDIWGLLNDVSDWLVDTFSISSNMSSPVTLYTSTAYRLADGTPINIGINMANAVMQFEVGTTYNTQNGYFFVNRSESEGTYLYTYDVHNGGTLIYSGESGSTTRYYDIYGFYLSGQIQFLLKATNSNVSRSVNTNKSAQDLFGSATDAEIDGLGKDLLPSLDYENAEEDDAVWVFPDTDVVNIPSTGSLESDVFGGFLDGTLDGSLVDAQTNAATRVIAQEGTAPIEPEPEIPTYELPLIGINFPANWSLNLHGIWYYVRQWVASIASFVSWLFGVYSNLPYTMVVPIYATAVIVIVLGIYKRFFM